MNNKRCRVSLVAFLLGCMLSPGVSYAHTHGGSYTRHNGINWSFSGIFGQFDNASLQRGFKVYSTVCSACHGIKHISIRSLEDIGFSPEEVKSIAASYQVEDGPDDSGQMFKRAGIPSDRVPSPFRNEQETATANNGAFPPDLSLIVKARQGGADYIYDLLVGYDSSSPDADGLFSNHAFPHDGKIAMPPPLFDGSVVFDDGTESTVHNMARDVTAFLSWTAEPELNERHRLGLKVMLFTLIVTVLFYFANRIIWSSVKKKK